MYKIVFVDDEFLVLQGLKKIIDWESYGIEIVGTAFSADEAIQIVEKKEPDIIITDIKMIDSDGIELLKKLNAINFNGYKIILSGYEDFRYAQKAIEEGVYRYMLKPINIDELKKVIEDITEKLSKSRNVDVSEDKRMNDVIAYVNQHFNDKDFSMVKVAKQNYFEISYFSRMFKKYTGYNFRDYVINLKMELAREYLTKTDYSIEKVAEIVGYNSVKFFRETFKKHYNSPPSQLRKGE